LLPLLQDFSLLDEIAMGDHRFEHLLDALLCGLQAVYETPERPNHCAS
jgi:hypothetical protein